MRSLGFKEAPGSWGASQGGEGLGSMNRPTVIVDVWNFGDFLRFFCFLSPFLSHIDRRRRAVFARLVNG